MVLLTSISDWVMAPLTGILEIVLVDCSLVLLEMTLL